MGISLGREEQFEVFGENWLGDEYAAEAEQRWPRAGPASDPAVMDLAEQHRRQIHSRVYDCPPAMHRGLGDMYVADPRFTEHYDGRRPGLAPYLRDAIHANADRQEAAAP